jgi:hypothetical protein
LGHSPKTWLWTRPSSRTAPAARVICTSTPVRSSTYLSTGFNLPTLRSIGFGSSTCDFGRAHPVPHTFTMLRTVGFPSAQLVEELGLATDRNSLARYSKRTHGPCVHDLTVASFHGGHMRLIVRSFKVITSASLTNLSHSTLLIERPLKSQQVVISK